MADDGDTRLRPLQVPLMYAFRDAAAKGDSRKAEEMRDASDARVLTQRGSVRRRGADEYQLRRNLDLDLGDLVNSISLGSCIDLGAHPRVRESVLNYGVRDMTHLTMDAVRNAEVAEWLRRALLRHEPRLLAESLVVTLRPEGDDDAGQRLAFEVSAEMACRPVDIPLEFVAELDVGSGKVRLRNLADTGPARRRSAEAPPAATPASSDVPRGSR